MKVSRATLFGLGLIAAAVTATGLSGRTDATSGLALSSVKDQAPGQG